VRTSPQAVVELQRRFAADYIAAREPCLIIGEQGAAVLIISGRQRLSRPSPAKRSGFMPWRFAAPRSDSRLRAISLWVSRVGRPSGRGRMKWPVMHRRHHGRVRHHARRNKSSGDREAAIRRPVCRTFGEALVRPGEICMNSAGNATCGPHTDRERGRLPPNA
jgi:hypothetical protein